MRRVLILISVVAVVLFGFAVTSRLPAITVAQEGTPPAGEFPLPEGVTFEPLGFGTAEELPAAPASVELFRFTVGPGARIPIEEDDPALALVYVEAGTLTFRVEAPIQVTRASMLATPGAGAGPEEVAAGTEFTLEAGDSAVFPPNVPGEVRNDGSEPAVGLATVIAPITEGAATPAAATPIS